MKIAYITMQFPAPSETFTSNDVRILKDLDNDISVFSLKSKHKDHESMIDLRKLNNIPIFSISYIEILLGIVEMIKAPLLFFSLLLFVINNEIKRPKHLIKILLLFPSSFYILKNIKKKNIDVLHLFWGHYPSIVAFLVHKTLAHVKISLFLGAYDLEYSLGISKKIAKISDFIFTHAAVNIKQLNTMEINTNKINIVHRGVDIKTFLEMSNNQKKDPNKWISVGRLLESKGFEKVIDVFSSFHKMNNLSKLYIIGSGPIKNKLYTKINNLSLESKVLLKGHLSQDLVIKNMSDSEIFILLSSKKGERLPNVIKEAMLSKCICISSYTPGIEELIIDGVNGFIIKDDDYSKIIKKISSLSLKEKEDLKNNAREHIINNFAVEKSMKQYLKIWSE